MKKRIHFVLPAKVPENSRFEKVISSILGEGKWTRDYYPPEETLLLSTKYMEDCICFVQLEKYIKYNDHFKKIISNELNKIYYIIFEEQESTENTFTSLDDGVVFIPKSESNPLIISQMIKLTIDKIHLKNRAEVVNKESRSKINSFFELKRVLMGQADLKASLNSFQQEIKKILGVEHVSLILKDTIVKKENDVKTTGKVTKVLREETNLYNYFSIDQNYNFSWKKEKLDFNNSNFIKFITNFNRGVYWEKDGSNYDLFEQLSCPFLPDIDEKQKKNLSNFLSFQISSTINEDIYGFILIANKLDQETPEKKSIKFTLEDWKIAEILSFSISQTIENYLLRRDVDNIFDSFIDASLVSLEQRDASTRGHSERVAMMTVLLAESVNKTDVGVYKDVYLNPQQILELKYAALLHDMGKIGVRENILQKEKKLFSHEMTNIQYRFKMIESRLYMKCLESYIQNLMQKGEAPNEKNLYFIQQEILTISTELKKFYSLIQQVNEPTVLTEDNFLKIAEIASMKFQLDEEEIHLLNKDEIEKLKIMKGSLSPSERLEIESHVTKSFEFLLKIPWTQNLKNVPEIVYDHHERLNGTGYPRKLKGDEIPFQSKIMAITDIYDALVADDRPYKKGLSHEKAVNILDLEVKAGKLDGELFKIFVDANLSLASISNLELDFKVA